MRIHFNKSNGIFSVRRSDRSTVTATEKRSVYGKLPLIGLSPYSLGANVYVIVTRGDLLEAQKGTRPDATVVHTKCCILLH